MNDKSNWSNQIMIVVSENFIYWNQSTSFNYTGDPPGRS